jgi:anti-sigma B factor antagonist
MNDLAQVTVGARGSVWLVEVRGEVDMSNAGMVADEMRETIPNHAEGVVLDLTHTSYMDSRGISLLFQVARRLTMRGQRFAIAVPENAPIRSVLSLTGVASVAEIYPSVPEAESGVVLVD